MPVDPVAICHRCPYRGPLVGRSIACTVNGKPITVNAAEYQCPAGRYPARGLGDVVANIIHAATLGAVSPCESCRDRRDRLNRLLPKRT